MTQKPTLAAQVHSARFITSSTSSPSRILKDDTPITPPQFSPTALTLRDNSVDSALFWNSDGRGGTAGDIEKVHGRKRSSFSATLAGSGRTSINEKIVNLPGLGDDKRNHNDAEDEGTPRARSKPFWKKYTLAATSSPSPSSNGVNTPVFKASQASEKTLAAQIVETHELSSYTLLSPRLPQNQQRTLARLDISTANPSNYTMREHQRGSEVDEIEISPTTLVHPPHPKRPSLDRRSTGSFGLGIGHVSHGQDYSTIGEEKKREDDDEEEEEEEEEEHVNRPRESIASSIDENMKYIAWEAPPAWGTPPLTSPRSSPIQFTERRLSNSLARPPHLFPTTSSPSAIPLPPPSSDTAARSASPTVSLAGAGRRASHGASRIHHHHQNAAGRRSQTYASVFSFDEAAEEDQDGDAADEKAAK
jgi:hypothetical protein